MARKPKPAPKPARRRRGAGSIVALADGTIRARLPANVDPKRSAREFPPGQMAAAVAWLDAMLHPAPDEPTSTAPITLREWGGTWHETYVAPIRPPNTIKWSLYALRQLAPQYAAPIEDVRASQLQAIVGQLAARLSASTVQAIVGVWRRCFDAAIEDGLIVRNPVRRLTIPRAPPRAVKRHVTPQEVAALWPAISGHRFEAAYALLLGCGLRIGEVLGLSWVNVDLANRRAWIQHQWTNSHWRDLPKGRVPRWVRLPDRVVSALIRHRNAQPAGSTLVMQSPHATLFGPFGRKKPVIRPWSALAVGQDLRAICAALDLDTMTAHAARRGLATALLDGGASPAIVAERLGHATPATTLKHYAGRSDEARAKADALIDRYLGDAPEDDVETDQR